MIDFPVSFTSKEITPWGGMAFLKQMLDKMRFSEVVAQCHDLPIPGSNRGYPPKVILESFIASIWCGANRFMHTEQTRYDPALARIFGWKSVPAQDAYKRYFSKFDQVTNLNVSQYFYSWIFNNLQFDHLTLDIDSTVLTRFGEQMQGAKKGYNPTKRGRRSHHPLIAFVSDLNLVANMWLRSGDTSSANNFLSFLEDTLQKLESKTVGLVRLDSGFFQSEILAYLEARSTDYIIAAKFTHPVQRLIANKRAWIKLEEGIEICEQDYKSDHWDKARRLVIVRQKINEKPNAPGKILTLFPEEEEYANYRYSAYVTSLKIGPIDVWRLYRGRAKAENHIKELKYDFGFESFSLRGFYATEAALTFAMIAFNLMSLFKMFILQESSQRRLATLRYRTFAIGAYFEKINDQIVLKIALVKRRRKWFRSLWVNPKTFNTHSLMRNLG